MARAGNSPSSGLRVTTVMELLSNRRTKAKRYFRAGLERSEEFDPDGALRSVTVRDRVRGRQIFWRTDRPEYIVMRTGRTPAAPKAAPGAPELIINRMTVDTGEQKTFFGQLAGHLITEETRHMPGSALGIPDSKTTLDGWYVESALVPDSTQARVTTVLFAGNVPPRITGHHTGPVPSGLPVFQKQTLTSQLPGGATHVVETTMQVIGGSKARCRTSSFGRLPDTSG